MAEYKKRETAYKMKIGDILLGTPIIEEVPQEINPDGQTMTAPVREKFRFLELGEKKIVRVNIIGNIVDKYSSDGEKKFATLTIDDASGQIRLKVFGDDINLFNDMSQGDSVLTIGLLRSYNGEVYISPEIVKKVDLRYLLIRKLELDKKSGTIKKEIPKEDKVLDGREQIIELIKSSQESSGISIEDIIMKVKSASPELINSEIIKLIEDGVVYEPRPGKVRWLG
jgi:RPA family protein